MSPSDARAPTAPEPSPLLVGGLAGSIGLGLPIALATVAQNRLASPLDALLLGADCLLIYGAAGALIVGGVAGAGALLRRLRRGPDGARALAPAVVAGGLWVFFAVFALGFFLHGVTYDQVPFGPPAGAAGMLLFLAMAAVAIIAGAGLLALGLRPLLTGAARTLGRRGVVAVWGAALLATPALAFVQPDAPGPSQSADPANMRANMATAHGGVSRLALIGLDGADWQVLRPMIERGELPQFARLVAEGVSGPLPTIADSNSAVIWASLYTGKRPEQHGVLDFFRVFLPGMRTGVFPVHRTYFREIADRLAAVGAARLRPISRLDLGAVPIWEIADHLGIPTGLIDGYYYSFPAPRLSAAGSYAVAYGADGFWQQVRQPGSGTRAADAGLFVHPPERLREIRDHLAAADFDWQSSSALALLRSQPVPRFLSLYTHEPDTVQHLEWKWYQPEKFPFVRAADVRRRGDRIPERYRAFDRFLGELRAALGPEAVILVVSDHGHSPTILHQDFYTQHRHGPPGIFLAAGGPFRRGVALAPGASIYDIFPTLLYLLGLPIPADVHGRLLDGALVPGFLAAEARRSIPTYEGLWPPPFTGDGESGLEAEELEKLRALGYL